MKLINMITGVSMKSGYHSLKSSGLSITCMATKSPWSCKEPSLLAAGQLVWLVLLSCIDLSCSNPTPLHLKHCAWDQSNKLPQHCFYGNTGLFVTPKSGGLHLCAPVLVGIVSGFGRRASYLLWFIQKWFCWSEAPASWYTDLHNTLFWSTDWL